MPKIPIKSKNGKKLCPAKKFIFLLLLQNQNLVIFKQMAPYFLFLPLPVNLCTTKYQTRFLQNSDDGANGKGLVPDYFFFQGNNMTRFKINKNEYSKVQKKIKNC